VQEILNWMWKSSSKLGRSRAFEFIEGKVQGEVVVEKLKKAS
jgi:hypothetical protein